MKRTTTCQTCCHFDAVHEMCPLYTVDMSLGEVYLRRLPESPTCKTNYVEKPTEEAFVTYSSHSS